MATKQENMTRSGVVLVELLKAHGDWKPGTQLRAHPDQLDQAKLKRGEDYRVLGTYPFPHVTDLPG